MDKKLSTKERLDQMSSDHAVVRIGGKVRIVSWQKSPIYPGVKVPVFSTRADMALLYSAEFIERKQRNADGSETTKRVRLFEAWMESKERATAEGVTMDASTGAGRFIDGRLNLWQGFAVQPREGEWPLLRRHMREVICSDSEEYLDYLTRWVAWRVQNPTLPPGVALVFSGAGGTGKGMFAHGVLCRIFGAHSLQISDRKRLTGKFNAHLRQCCLLFADEAFRTTDKEGDGPLKRLITEPTLVIKMKGVGEFEIPNSLAVVIAGTEDWLIPASGDERRYAVFKVSGRYAQDFAYFDTLQAELDSGGIEAFLHDMLSLDLGDWHPRRDVPQTDALGKQKLESAKDVELWLWGILAEGALPRAAVDRATGYAIDVAVPKHPSRARSRALYLHAKASARNPANFMSEPAFREWIELEGVVDGQRDSKSKVKEFGTLAEARARWNERRPWSQVPDDGSDWRLGD